MFNPPADAQPTDKDQDQGGGIHRCHQGKGSGQFHAPSYRAAKLLATSLYWSYKLTNS
jgi:hypothetical protein